QPLCKDRTVAEPGQGIAGAGGAPLLLSAPILCRVGQRSSDSRRPLAGASRGEAAAQEQPVGAVLVSHAVLVLEVLGRAGEMRIERCLERNDVVGMHTAHPFLGATDAGGRRQAEHRLPSPGYVTRLGWKITLPQPVLRS